jgi:predicted TIM-barrel fold metal-dependent hydrolase
LIKEFPKIPIVLLHSSYPYTREAGYLASVYENVYLDFGEVFPMLSKEGQKSVIKEMLELAPINKLLWSSDGHWFPETYILASLQTREVLYEVGRPQIICQSE